ncbi:F0F1 ATP synthase subunit A [Candidatus Carsonella ruddii]|uniref:F0F1 ATP synthase subunit A n=2 Tax=cellular organisms TaxID=131567 RepID=A0AAJ6JXQ2_CARRU|nr:F0F1 ATP synthase subunit A [Candidatus Carsonella ruddii]WGS66672.1 F0F1 ATP synthase subunit A [Candidatus Carsonella ruddii]WGS66868.1 F0F1 ATP synthase subunit A [Candidatus Carsonella ruddii]WGS67060.1 F0F1 ATP synthase subunit A [Candidatus Carsonella ruddii]WGS67252.1 F0F1 ATP synthase subunit A [Candidatus Carsonella ruddii]WMC18268.1 MAG: F0F1 ATP synthase subunit A [Candidatus Carsonella ruddii]
MDILKNIYLNFNFLKSIIDIKLSIFVLIVKFLLFIFLKKRYLNQVFLYFNNFIKKTINKSNRKILILASILIFNNILFYNLIDLLPIDFIKHILNLDELDIVPTSNINITFSLSFFSFLIINYIAIKKIGIIKFVLNFFNNPIKSKYMIFFNFIIEFISFIMKPISLSLRLFGNIFSSDIIFNLISNMKLISNVFLNSIWGIFHYLILPLQSFIFITLIIIYLSQTIKH